MTTEEQSEAAHDVRQWAHSPIHFCVDLDED